ncbi:MAG: photosystem I assembly protein Ycf3 [bacterium ADurb.Bin400]|nr:MAG: photosystem I assembly protein Ycf3 [bacterium ADurb.Bin400]
MISILVALSRGRRGKYVLFGLLWFLLLLIPSFVYPNPSSPNSTIVLEHRIYLPIVGLLIVLLEVDLIRRWYRSGWGIAAVVVVVIVLSAATSVHVPNFQNRVVFWENAVKNSPHFPLAHRNLGAMYYLDGDLERAKTQYEKALALNPAEPMVHNNLGLIFEEQGDLARAEEEYRKEIEIDPLYDNALYNLGLLKYKQGKNEEAKEWWRRAVEANPYCSDAYRALITLAYQNKQAVIVKYYIDEMRKKGLPISFEVLQMERESQSNGGNSRLKLAP